MRLMLWYGWADKKIDDSPLSPCMTDELDNKQQGDPLSSSNFPFTLLRHHVFYSVSLSMLDMYFFLLDNLPCKDGLGHLLSCTWRNASLVFNTLIQYKTAHLFQDYKKIIFTWNCNRVHLKSRKNFMVKKSVGKIAK